MCFALPQPNLIPLPNIPFPFPEMPVPGWERMVGTGPDSTNTSSELLSPGQFLAGHLWPDTRPFKPPDQNKASDCKRKYDPRFVVSSPVYEGFCAMV